MRASKFLVLSLAFSFLSSNFALLSQPAFAGVEEGKKLFAQYCASCHGEKGKGDGPAAAMLNPKPKDLSNKANTIDKGDEFLLKVIKGGGAAAGLSPIMPSWGAAMTDAQIKDVIDFVKSLAK